MCFNVFHVPHTSSTVSSSKTFFKGLHGKFHETLGVRCRAGGSCMQLLDISTSATAESSSVMACRKLVGLVSPCKQVISQYQVSCSHILHNMIIMVSLWRRILSCSKAHNKHPTSETGTLTTRRLFSAELQTPKLT